MQQRRVNFHTLGCKLNFSESSTLAREFERGGFVRVAPDAEAESLRFSHSLRKDSNML